MQSKFSEAILEMQQKSGLKYLILEKKIAAMKEELDVKEAQLHAVVEHGTTKKGDALNGPRSKCGPRSPKSYVYLACFFHKLSFVCVKNLDLDLKH